MDTFYKFIATIFIAVLPTLAFSQLTRTEFSVDYITKKYKPTKKTRTEKTNYEKYDSKGNVIEEGEYGEIKHYGSIKKNNDSTTTITTGHGRNYDNLNTVKFNKYDMENRLVEDELWQYNNNNKSYLIYRTQYDYNSKGQLAKETEFNKDNKISRTKTYHISSNRIASSDTVYNFTNEGIIRVDGERRDTTYLDTLNRPTETIHIFKGKFLYKQAFLYDKYANSKTELRYDNKQDSLWCITEYRYDIFDNKLTRRLWKVIGSSTETKQIYEYDKKRRLVKILNYSVDELTGYTKFEYSDN
jgi:hypothetical protein